MGVCERISFPGLEGLRVGRYGKKVNTSCILFRIGDTVIDTGPPNMWRVVKRFLKEREVSRVLVTHHHEDHSGNLGRLQKLWQPEIFAAQEGIPLLNKGFPLPLYRRLVWGKPKLKVSAKVLPEALQLPNHFLLQTIKTPGHSEDMVCYLEPNRGWVFSGDLYVASKPKFARHVEDPNQEIESLRHLLTFDFQTVFCSHRGILEDGRQAIARKLNYLLALREQVRHYRKVGDSIQEISHRFLGKETFLHYFSLGDYAKANYIRAFAKYVPKPDSAIEFIETAETEDASLAESAAS